MSTITSKRTKTLALIIIFVALAVVLNLVGPKIPYPFAPYLFFQFWEIPLVVAFLLIGFRAGVLVTVLNTLILFFVSADIIVRKVFRMRAAKEVEITLTTGWSKQ